MPHRRLRPDDSIILSFLRGSSGLRQLPRAAQRGLSGRSHLSVRLISGADLVEKAIGLTGFAPRVAQKGDEGAGLIAAAVMRAAITANWSRPIKSD